MLLSYKYFGVLSVDSRSMLYGAFALFDRNHHGFPDRQRHLPELTLDRFSVYLGRVIITICSNYTWGSPVEVRSELSEWPDTASPKRGTGP